MRGSFGQGIAIAPPADRLESAKMRWKAERTTLT
jgi:hypothetical protein